MSEFIELTQALYKDGSLSPILLNLSHISSIKPISDYSGNIDPKNKTRVDLIENYTVAVIDDYHKILKAFRKLRTNDHIIEGYNGTT